jgi:hypothetical protein
MKIGHLCDSETLLLITFRDGRPRMTGLIDESDQVAAALIEGLIDVVEAPGAASENAFDAIGARCGQA